MRLTSRVNAKLLAEVEEYDAVPSEAASYAKPSFWDERYATDEEVRAKLYFLLSYFGIPPFYVSPRGGKVEISVVVQDFRQMKRGNVTTACSGHSTYRKYHGDKKSVGFSPKC